MYVDFVAVDELQRRPLRSLPEIDQRYLADHARYRGIKQYSFTIQEYTRLRAHAEERHLGQELVKEFDKDYSFMYWITRKVRTGAINSITGMCYDIAIRNYAQIARTIEKAKQE